MVSCRRRARLVVLLVMSAALAASAPLAAQPRAGLAGIVRDATDSSIAGASVLLVTAEQAVVARGQTDQAGRFSLPAVPRGRYLLVVSYPGFAERRVAIAVPPLGREELRLVLEPAAVTADVTVTATPGRVQGTASSPQPVTVLDAAAIDLRAKSVVAQAVAEEAGLHLLRTSPTIAGIYVRGLTGNKVNVFLDGVRYSTSAMRGGISTFLDLIEPSSLQSMEVLRGPNSAQYGSDAIGGSVQFLSPLPTLAGAPGGRFSGTAGGAASGADLGLGTHVSAGYGWGRVGLFASLGGRTTDKVRAGRGIDSHSAVTRFLGLPSDRLMPSRLPDTGFTQYGGMAKVTWSRTADEQVTAYYTRNQQDGGRRYDQLLGGDGNLVADLRNLMLDFFYARYQRIGVGWFDQVSFVYSFNSQREERVNQGGNGNPRGSITHEYERTNALGFQANASRAIAGHEIRVGGEFYPERIHAPSFSFSPVTQVFATRRGRVPDQASYRSGGVFVQDTFEPVAGRLKVVANARFGAASYESKAADSPLVGGKRLWPDDSLTARAVTFRAGLVATPGPEALTLTANVSRGYRAPHITDLGTAGLTGSGFQVTASALDGLGATVGSTAGASAGSTGVAVEQVRPETSLSYEAGVHYRVRRFRTDLSVFVNDVYDNIAYQALILPSGSVGRVLGNEVVTAQGPTGVVYVAASSSPVLVRTNFGDARIYGFEHSLEWRPRPAWTVSTAFTYLHAADADTGVPPTIEGGTPAPDGYLKLRYLEPRGRFWIEPYLHAAARQERLSSLDLEDRRTGATRSRSSIRSFFYNGAAARGWVGSGADGIAGNADDVLTATGETLAQVQNRVLGAGVESAPLFTAVPGYVTAGIRGGIHVGERYDVTVDVENLGDRNYRGIAWGIDAPGRNVSVRFRAAF